MTETTKRRPRKQAETPDTAAAMNDLARRIWDAQSPDLSVSERLRRIKERLVRQGYTDFARLELP